MSKKLDNLDLEVIQELANSSQKVQDLIKQKYKTIYEIERSQNTRFKKLDPAPKPKGDVRINKQHSKEIISNEVLNQKLQHSKDEFNLRIKEALEEKAFEEDKESLHPTIEGMDKGDISALIENGRDAYKERIQVRKKELEESLKLDVNSIDDKYIKYPIYSDFEKNLEDLDNKPSPSDDFE